MSAIGLPSQTSGTPIATGYSRLEGVQPATNSDMDYSLSH